MSKRQSFGAIDIAKFVMAFIIILIHTNYFAFPNEYIEVFIDRVITMVCVPFFLVASGFFFFQSIQFENGKIKKCTENKQRLISFLKRTTILYIAWLLIYLVWQIFSWINMGVMTFTNFKGYMFSVFTKGFSEQFWYVLFMIYTIPLLYILLRFLKTRIVVVLSLVFCFLYFYNASYFTATKGALPWLDKIASTVSTIKLTTTLEFSTSLIYFAACFLLMGLVCVKIKDKLSTKAAGLLTLASLVLCTFEITILRYCYNVFQCTQTLSFIPLALFLFLFLAKLNVKGNKKVFDFLRKCSTIIYA
ncbi:MAG: acyltransferase family protein, partial [Clostridia bacterium]|nr:acyltransferase family protein [Clostridia bacterium]